MAAYVVFGLCSELDNVHAEILTGLACAGQHGLPIGRRHIFHDDRNGRLRLRDGGRPERKAGNDFSRYHKLFHGHTPVLEAPGPLNWVRNPRPGRCAGDRILKVRSEPSLRNTHL